MMRRAPATTRSLSAGPAYSRCLAGAALVASMAGGGCPKGEPEEAGEPAGEPDPEPEPELEPPEPPPLPAATELPEDPGGHSGELRWAIRFGGPDKDAARSIAALDGGAVVAGYVSGAATIGEASHEADEVDGYVTRLDAGGAPMWTRFFSGAGEDTVGSVAVTESGNIVVAGAFASELAIGEEALGSAGADDIFVAALSPDGERLWARSFGGHDVDAAHHVAAGPGGRIYVTGVFRETVEFGEHTLESAGDADIFALALSADGDPIWAERFGARGPDYGRALVPHPHGLALLGEFSLEVDFGDESLSSAGNRDLVIAMLDPAGQPRWARSFGGYYHEVGVDLAVDPAGNLLVTGSFDDEIDFGAGALEAEGQSDAFLAKLDPEGNALWSERIGGDEEDVGASVSVDRYGNVIAAGWFWYEAAFGDPPLESAGRRDGYVAKLSPAGEHVWSIRVGGEAGDMTRSVAVGDDGRVFAAGTFHRAATVGDVKLEAARDEGAEIPYGDAFVISLAP